MRCLYRMPLIGSGLSQQDARRPKYARQIEAFRDHSWGMQELPDGSALVKVDGPGSLHRALRRQPDCEVVSYFDKAPRRAIAFGHEQATGQSFREQPVYTGGEAI